MSFKGNSPIANSFAGAKAKLFSMLGIAKRRVEIDAADDAQVRILIYRKDGASDQHQIEINVTGDFLLLQKQVNGQPSQNITVRLDLNDLPAGAQMKFRQVTVYDEDCNPFTAYVLCSDFVAQ